MFSDKVPITLNPRRTVHSEIPSMRSHVSSFIEARLLDLAIVYGQENDELLVKALMGKVESVTEAVILLIVSLLLMD